MDYQKQANDFAKKRKIKLIVNGYEYKPHFNDKTLRYVFSLTLKSNNKQYTFEFGQSTNQGNKEPTMYDVLTCLTKYNPETFEDFCSEFGYDEDSRSAERIYNAVVKEWEAMERLFSPECLEEMQEIQ